MNKVYLGLGSNVGNKIENVVKAIEYFQKKENFVDFNYSSIYETLPYGNIEQENFINCAISFLTDLSLLELFNLTKQIEKEIGRIKRETWGPREIDIDILLFSDTIFENDKLKVPHKDLVNRDFVLVPLLELDENLEHPLDKKKIKIFLSEMNDKYIIRKINLNLSANELFEEN